MVSDGPTHTGKSVTFAERRPINHRGNRDKSFCRPIVCVRSLMWVRGEVCVVFVWCCGSSVCVVGGKAIRCCGYAERYFCAGSANYIM